MDSDFNLELLKRETSNMSETGLTFRKASFKDSIVPPAEEKPKDEEEKSKEKEEKEKGRDVSELGREFGKRTTAHGWGRVVNAKGRVVKLVWMAFTLIALTCSMIQITMLFISFLSFSTEIKWQLSIKEIEFPSVTLCNVQPYSMSTAQKLMANESSKFFQWYNITRTLDGARESAAQLNLSKEFEWVENRMKQPIGYFENIGDEAQIVGHQGIDFIIRCSFGLTYCNASNFTFYQSPTYYNCYTFNGGNVSREKLISKTSGPQEGLSLILYLENDNGVSSTINGTYHTLSNIGNAGGVRVIVHAPNTRPSPVDQGMDIPPGFSANIGLDVSRYERQDDPWGDCFEPDEWSTDRYVYSSHACLALCQQLYVTANCGCISSTLPVANNDFLNLTYCAAWNFTSSNNLTEYFHNIQCEADKLMKFATDEELKSYCNCFPTCEEYGYKTDLSYSYWPLDFTQEDFYRTLIQDNPNRDKLKAYNNLKNFSKNELIERELIRHNFARVNVYLKGMMVEEYLEKKSYELANLFSDIGGSFGLWIGMSIITWCEVVELLTHVIYHGSKRLKWKTEQAQSITHTDKGKY